MSKYDCKATTQVAVIFAIALALAACWAVSTITMASESMQLDDNRTLATSSDIDSTWRHTKFGWQDSAFWRPADSFRPVKTIELLHPFVWAGIVLIAVIATMIWASSEWEISRLFESDDDQVAKHHAPRVSD